MGYNIKTGLRNAIGLLFCTSFYGSIILSAVLFSSDISHAVTKDDFLKVEKEYQTFKLSPRSKYRHSWLGFIDRFQKIYAQKTEDKYAPECMYAIGRAYQELHRYSGKTADINGAIEAYTTLCRDFPDSPAAQKARRSLEALKGKEAISDKGKQEKFEETDSQEEKSGMPVEEASTRTYSKTKIDGIRCWTTADYTRVVVDAQKQVRFKAHLLKKDREGKKAARLYIDVFESVITPDLKEPIPVMDGLLRYVRAGQYKADTVRVVLDIESLKKYKVFYLVNPFRIVVDITGENGKTKPEKGKELTLAQQLGLNVRKIIIDAGHGGKDCGAVGVNGLKEKDIVLKVARRLRDKIKEQLGCNVILTRDSDKFLPLEERTAIANTKEGDLFISIHANSAPNREAHGIETYFLNLSTDDNAMRVAARENATSTKSVSDLQKILNDLMMNSKINESCRLAEYVQSSLVGGLSRDYDRITNLGVKQAPFFVLIGAQMPAVLVEISFLSNQMEANLLKKEEYLDEIAECLSVAVKKYAHDTNLAYLKR